MKILRNNGLTLVLLAVFVFTLFGQLWSGLSEYNQEHSEHGLWTISIGQYVGTSHFWQAVAENWESEFLQMAAFVWLTGFLFQKGSPESKDPDDPEEDHPELHQNDSSAPWPVRKGGWIMKIYSHSLSLFFLGIFIFSFVLHIFAGQGAAAHEALINHLPQPTLGEYFTSGKFWFESMQNWQSEFLSLVGMVYGSIYLRERNSPESKAVESPHDAHE